MVSYDDVIHSKIELTQKYVMEWTTTTYIRIYATVENKSE